MTQARSRRRFMKTAFIATLGAGVVGVGGVLVRFLYPRDVTDDGVVVISASDVPRPGDPPLTDDAGGFYLVNLRAGEGLFVDGDTSPGGLLALASACTHLVCGTRWLPDFVDTNRQTPIKGVFDCPCHGSRFTKAGLRLFGPASRSLDTFRVDVTSFGDVRVHTERKIVGAADDARRAVPWTRPL